ncbi:ComF family protein [Micropruina sp.]|uniref:ComF family protein n=1 Tax=Micropruina sp. TaxID=2737536 RepID=UPI0039E4A912
MGWRALAAAAADLAWGGACAACAAPGPVLCPGCAGLLRRLPTQAVPVRPGVPPTIARGDYADELRAVILACKERQGLGLVPMLAELVTGSAAALLHERWSGAAVRVAPIPSARSTIGERGFDLTGMMAGRVAVTLRGVGMDVRGWRALRPVRRSADQAGLGIAERAANRRASLVARPGEPVQVLLIDDIVTTGATLAEARRALTVAGHSVLGAAVVAATPRTGTPGTRTASRTGIH